MIRHEVVTGEKGRLRYRVAGLGSRLSAYLLDLGLWAVLAFMGAMVMLVLELGGGGGGTWGRGPWSSTASNRRARCASCWARPTSPMARRGSGWPGWTARRS